MSLLSINSVFRNSPVTCLVLFSAMTLSVMLYSLAVTSASKDGEVSKAIETWKRGARAVEGRSQQYGAWPDAETTEKGQLYHCNPHGKWSVTIYGDMKIGTFSVQAVCFSLSSIPSWI